MSVILGNNTLFARRTNAVSEVELTTGANTASCVSRMLSFRFRTGIQFFSHVRTTTGGNGPSTSCAAGNDDPKMRESEATGSFHYVEYAMTIQKWGSPEQQALFISQVMDASLGAEGKSHRGAV